MVKTVPERCGPQSEKMNEKVTNAIQNVRKKPAHAGGRQRTPALSWRKSAKINKITSNKYLKKTNFPKSKHT
jgi:hypothetical protein